MNGLGTTRSIGDRLLAVAFVCMAVLVLVGVSASGQTTASFTGVTSNPSNHLQTLNVQPPAGQNNPTSAASGVVQLSWSATPTAPGTGHTLTYLVFRGPVGGPYTQIANTASLSYNDTPSSDGSYGYVIEAQITGGGSFTSSYSAAKTGISDRVAPTMSITCNSGSCAGWFNAAVSVTVTGSDSGTGMGSVTRNVDSSGQVSSSGASATFSVSGESAGHTVAYFGTDAAGNVSSTTTQTVKIDLTAPTAATGLTSAKGSTAGTINLTWTAGTDALSGVAGYTIRRSNVVTTCPAQSATNYPNTIAVGAVTSYTVTGLTTGSKYCFYLVTNDNAGNASANSTTAGPTAAK